MSGTYAQAFGFDHTASGNCSTAFGWGNKAQAAGSFVAGTFNIPQGDPLARIETDDIFAIGNGTADTSRSNAIKTLKNGQTTVTNKEWKVATNTAPLGGSATALANPASLTDSDGEALVVEGHARLKGKVIIEQPQGDISMGIYQ